MARDYFVGWSMEDKKKLLRGVQESMLTGNVVRVETAHGVSTSFDPKTSHPDQILERLEYSIANDPNYDANDAVQAACAGNVRPGTTRARFNGC